MPISPALVGTHHRYPYSYVVEREKIRELSLAIQNRHQAHHSAPAAATLGHHGLLAPPTFLCILGYAAQKWFLQHSGITINDKKIAQVDQRFTLLRRLIEGDVLHCEVHMHEIRTAFGADIITTKNVITDEAGTQVQLGYTTLMGQTGDEPGFTQQT
ncbi:MaoC family dehydratase N-terminal domain-containing protein [Mycobacteroides chelonae]|uniref:FAS1-like dehydratase domain-containing protein n=1 Tax=Mycobacteroides chelonae TaxID=1774 RepID=UPI001C2C91F1|nr:MaoC family dehydratase N-terminal domain-containing protein [Mycobacteroides chelonae]MBV0918220.1 MaoC family dehydratase N-terminal domain-containing protein [Mycobacteroides chelonae]UJW66086.1 MaoC family dehydratase N-terminal domain-containing protein [Mycobacteroides chelonae]